MEVMKRHTVKAVQSASRTSNLCSVNKASGFGRGGNGEAGFEANGGTNDNNRVTWGGFDLKIGSEIEYLHRYPWHRYLQGLREI